MTNAEMGINFEGLINIDSILEWLMSMGILYEKNQKGKEKKKNPLSGWFQRKPQKKGADKKQNPPAKRSHGADKQ